MQRQDPTDRDNFREISGGGERLRAGLITHTVQHANAAAGFALCTCAPICMVAGTLVLCFWMWCYCLIPPDATANWTGHSSIADHRARLHQTSCRLAPASLALAWHLHAALLSVTGSLLVAYTILLHLPTLFFTGCASCIPGLDGTESQRGDHDIHCQELKDKCT